MGLHFFFLDLWFELILDEDVDDELLWAQMFLPCMETFLSKTVARLFIAFEYRLRNMLVLRGVDICISNVGFGSCFFFWSMLSASVGTCCLELNSRDQEDARSV